MTTPSWSSPPITDRPAGFLSEFGNLGSPDMGSPGPFRGELGEATEGAIRTFCFIRWPGHVAPNTTSYAMFSIMDFLPTFAAILGTKLPTDRPIDGVDQIRSAFWQERDRGHASRCSPSSVRIWWRRDGSNGASTSRTCTRPALGRKCSEGCTWPAAPMWFPKIYNIEMDPHED